MPSSVQRCFPFRVKKSQNPTIPNQPPNYFQVNFLLYNIVRHHVWIPQDEDFVWLQPQVRLLKKQLFQIHALLLSSSELIHKSPIPSILSNILNIPSDYHEDIMRKINSLVRSMLRAKDNNPSIVVTISDMELQFHYHDQYYEATARAAMESMGMAAPRFVPALKTSIDELEKVRVEIRPGIMEKCSICMDDFEAAEEVTRMPCLHYFHGDCIGKWLDISHCCPLCRFPMPSAD